MRQLKPAASVDAQALIPFAMEKSAELVPVMVMPAIESGALPELVSVAVCAALVAPETAVKVSVAGVSEAMGAAGAVPVPLKATVCGEPEALSAMERVAVKLAAEAGVKVREIEQLDPAATEAPHVLVCAKSVGLAPVMVMPLMLRAAVPGFDSVTGIDGAVVFAVVAGNMTAPGLSIA